jgi:hypothetical protein
MITSSLGMTFTAEDGTFVLRGAKAGETYMVRVSKSGMRFAQSAISMVAGRNAFATFGGESIDLDAVSCKLSDSTAKLMKIVQKTQALKSIGLEVVTLLQKAKGPQKKRALSAATKLEASLQSMLEKLTETSAAIPSTILSKCPAAKQCKSINLLAQKKKYSSQISGLEALITTGIKTLKETNLSPRAGVLLGKASATAGSAVDLIETLADRTQDCSN